MKLFISLIAAAALSGCAAGPAVITDAHSDSVKIQENINTPPDVVNAKGREACAMFNRTAVGPVSFRCLDSYCLTKVHLFICKPDAK
jgi:hypothetical protein